MLQSHSTPRAPHRPPPATGTDGPPLGPVTKRPPSLPPNPGPADSAVRTYVRTYGCTCWLPPPKACPAESCPRRPPLIPPSRHRSPTLCALRGYALHPPLEPRPASAPTALGCNLPGGSRHAPAPAPRAAAPASAPRRAQPRHGPEVTVACRSPFVCSAPPWAGPSQSELITPDSVIGPLLVLVPRPPPRPAHPLSCLPDWKLPHRHRPARMAAPRRMLGVDGVDGVAEVQQAHGAAVHAAS